MGCQSSKPASRPVSTPAGTLLASDTGVVKSPQATAGLEPATEAGTQLEPVEAAAPVADHTLQLSDVCKGPEEKADEVARPSAEGAQLEQEKVTVSAHVDPVLVNDVSPQAQPSPVVDSAAADVPVPVSQPTSRVHKNPQGWEEEGILFPHEGIRFLMQELSDAVNSMDPLPAWKWENLSTWYQDYFYTVVHHHHDAEEKIYLPWIQTRTSVPPKITADHPELMSAMDDLSAMLKKGASAPVADRASHLKDVKLFLSAFVEDMQQHLAEEEEIIPEALRTGGFTQEDEAPVVGKIIEGLGLDGNKKALPPMLHAYARWAGAEKAEAFVSSNLPLPIQFLYRNFWEHDFQHRHMGLLASLAEGVDTNPFASKWFC